MSSTSKSAIERMKAQLAADRQRISDNGAVARSGAPMTITRMRTNIAGVKATVLVLSAKKDRPLTFGVKIRFTVLIVSISSIISHASREGNEYTLNACGRGGGARNDATCVISEGETCEISTIVPLTDRFAQSPPTVGIYETHIWFENNESKGVTYPTLCCTAPFVDVVAAEGFCQLQAMHNVVDFLSMATGERGLVAEISDDRIGDVAKQNERLGDIRRKLKEERAKIPPGGTASPEVEAEIKRLEEQQKKKAFDVGANRNHPYLISVNPGIIEDENILADANPHASAYQIVVEASKGIDTYCKMFEQQVGIEAKLLAIINQTVPKADGSLNRVVVNAGIDVSRYELGEIFSLPFVEWDQDNKGLVNGTELNGSKKLFASFLENYLHRMRLAMLCIDDTVSLSRAAVPSVDATFATSLATRAVSLDVIDFLETFGFRVTPDAVEALFDKYATSFTNPKERCHIRPEQRKYAYKTVTSTSSLINIGTTDPFMPAAKTWIGKDFYIVPHDPMLNAEFLSAMKTKVTNTSAPIGREELIAMCTRWDTDNWGDTPVVHVFALDREKAVKGKTHAAKIIEVVKKAIAARTPSKKRSLPGDDDDDDDGSVKKARVESEYEDSEEEADEH